MSNARPKPTPVTSSIHILITAFLGIVVTALCCYSFYTFRTGLSKEQSITDAMKVIRASTEIVSSMAQRGLPEIRGRLEDLETRGRMLEKTQRETSSVISRLSTSAAPVAAPVLDPVASEAAILEARKAARAARQ